VTLADGRTQSTILIVDDESVIRGLCARVLNGFDIFEAGGAEEALTIFEREHPDVVLADIMMPNMSGLELLRAIKAQAPNQIVVLMTGFAEKEIILQALKSGADEFISKPINLLQLRTAIDSVLEKKKLKEELLDLKHSDHLKAEFLGLVSHKLKTPTTAIYLFIQNLASGAVVPEGEAYRDILDRILDESRHLDNLIKDLLSFSEIILHQDGPKIELTDVHQLLAEVTAPFRERFHHKGIDFEVHLPATLRERSLDSRRIHVVVWALLDNALKFTPQGGRVRFSVTDGTELVIEVTDNGVGINSEELLKITEKFYQVDPQRTGQVRGFGLGLYYAQRFVRVHGGRLSFTSTPGQGTTVKVVLP